MAIVGVESAILWGAGPPRHRFFPPGRPPLLEESLIQWQIDPLLTSRASWDVLILGDSSCVMGVRPLLVQRETGLRTRGAGTISWCGIRSHMDVLEAYLAGHPPPRLVVYHMANAPMLGETFLARAGYRERIQAWLADNFGADRRRFWPLPSRAYRLVVQEALEEVVFSSDLRDQPRGPYPGDRELARLLAEHQGALEEITPYQWTEPPELEWELTRDGVEGFAALARLAQAHGFSALWMFNPLPEIARTARNEEVLRRREADVRELVRRNPPIELLEPLVRYYPNQQLANPNHLYQVGAEKNTRELIAWMRARGFAASASAPEAGSRSTGEP